MPMQWLFLGIDFAEESAMFRTSQTFAALTTNIKRLLEINVVSKVDKIRVSTKMTYISLILTDEPLKTYTLHEFVSNFLAI